MRRGIIEDNSAQISAELIIIMAAVLAVALLFVGNLSKTVETASKEMADKSDGVIKGIRDIPTLEP